MLFGPGDQRGAAGQIPFAPRRDHLDVGVQRIGRQFEAHLIIALARRAMRHRVGAGFLGDLDQPLRNQRPRDRGAEQVIALVPRIGAHHREDEIADEFLFQIVDIDMFGLDPHQLGLGARGLQFFALPQIGGEGHHFAAIGDLQPLQDDAGIETARIGEDDALEGLGHDGTFGEGMTRARLAARPRDATPAMRAAWSGRRKLSNLSLVFPPKIRSPGRERRRRAVWEERSALGGAPDTAFAGDCSTAEKCRKGPARTYFIAPLKGTSFPLARHAIRLAARASAASIR